MLTPTEIALIFDLDNTLLMSNIDFSAVRQQLIDMLQAAGAADRPRDALLHLSLSELVDVGARATPPLIAPMWEAKIGRASCRERV